jgi:hypothetical protein
MSTRRRGSSSDEVKGGFEVKHHRRAQGAADGVSEGIGGLEESRLSAMDDVESETVFAETAVEAFGEPLGSDEA